MPSILSQKEIERALHQGIREADKQRHKLFRAIFWKVIEYTKNSSSTLYHAIEVNDFFEPIATDSLSGDPDLVTLAQRILRQYIVQGYQIEVDFRHPQKNRIRRDTNGSVYKCCELADSESFLVSRTLLGGFLEGEQTSEPKYTSREKWDEYLEEIWSIKFGHHHLTQEQVMLFTDKALSDGEDMAREDQPMTAIHLDSCSECRVEYELLFFKAQEATSK